MILLASLDAKELQLTEHQNAGTAEADDCGRRKLVTQGGETGGW